MTTDAGFEDEIKRSLPRKTGGGGPIYTWKIPSPATRREKHGDTGMEFSPKMPFDFLVVAQAEKPTNSHPGYRGDVPVPVIAFALECKHTFGKIAKAPKSRAGRLHATLPFSRVGKHQVKGLSEAGAGGVVAGIIWLVELNPDSEDFHGLAEGSEVRDQCWFIPIETWKGYTAMMGAMRKSLGFDEITKLGASLTAPAIEIHEDVGRGTANRYWKMGEFMRRLGADARDK